MVSLTRLNRGSLDKINQTLLPIDKTNLVRYYAFWENSGTTLYDESKGGNGGTISGATWTWLSSFAKPGLSYDGTDDIVDVPALSSFSTWTVMVCSKHESVNDGDQDADVGFDQGIGLVSMKDFGDGTYMAQMYDGGNWTKVGITSISNGVWNLWTSVYDGTNLTLYKNDASTGSATVSSNSSGRVGHYLGKESDSYIRHLDGVQSLVLVYDTNKSASFIASMVEKLGVV